ncbi:histone family protein [Halococcus qingdaonensis]|uniref:histone family protein n=1 Tax=Halococcus qingdaonensis TaxID=224402 RepID=UPI002115F9A7|nr:histone [Halococcus qingdaonensis]
MSVELPFAPVDAIIRRHAGSLRVSSEATEELARRIQRRGARLASEAADRATDDDRKTLRVADFDGGGSTDSELPIAPVDRIARLDIDERYRVSMDARVALAGILERYAGRVASAAAVLARHADRRTITLADVEAYFELEPYYPTEEAS